MSDDIIKRLREAIAAGPVPGPWMHLFGDRLIYTKLGDGCKGEAVARVDWISGPSYLATLSFIAAASPDNIAALLDRLDKAERENERLHRALQMAQGWIEEDRRLFVASASVAGEPKLDDFERRALAGYDALLAEIGAALAAEKGKE